MVCRHRAGQWTAGNSSGGVEREGSENRALAGAGCAGEQQRAFALQQPVVERDGRRDGQFAWWCVKASGFAGVAVFVELPGMIALPGGGGGFVLMTKHLRISRVSLRSGSTLKPWVELLDPCVVDLRQTGP